jgi:tetratricopeptide (TPR) repeat protein
MGMAQEAIGKWKQVLDAKPDHRDAASYLSMAERDLENADLTPTRAPSRPAEPQDSTTHPAAAWTQSPVFAPMAAISLEEFEGKAEVPTGEISVPPVAPPVALTAPSASPSRKGLALPQALQGLTLPPWLNSPIFILGSIIGLVVLVAGSILYHRWRKDIELRNAVAAFSAEALQPVARSSQIISLDETPESLRSEAERVLNEDPLVAYYRVQELMRLNPGDAPAAELMEKAKVSMANATTSPAATMKDYERQRQEGDLDSAYGSITQLLLLNPDDPALKERAIRLVRALCQIHASKEDWPKAEECLKRGRALAPMDRSWNARLKLMEHIQQMPKGDRLQWVQLLG